MRKCFGSKWGLFTVRMNSVNFSGATSEIWIDGFDDFFGDWKLLNSSAIQCQNTSFYWIPSKIDGFREPFCQNPHANEAPAFSCSVLIFFWKASFKKVNKFKILLKLHLHLCIFLASKVWGKKTGHAQKLAISKKSTFFRPILLKLGENNLLMR